MKFNKMFKKFAYVILVLMIQNILLAEAIKCYKCEFAPYVYYSNNTYLCKDFDYTDKFIVDCPYSTFCVKKNTQVEIKGVKINGTERFCAQQKLDTQKRVNGRWYPETLIEEPYTEGCRSTNEDRLRTANVEYCYCRGELCNSGNTVFSASDVFYYRTLAIGAFSVLMTCKTAVLMFL